MPVRESAIRKICDIGGGADAQLPHRSRCVRGPVDVCSRTVRTSPHRHRRRPGRGGHGRPGRPALRPRGTPLRARSGCPTAASGPSPAPSSNRACAPRPAPARCGCGRAGGCRPWSSSTPRTASRSCSSSRRRCCGSCAAPTWRPPSSRSRTSPSRLRSAALDGPGRSQAAGRPLSAAHPQQGRHDRAGRVAAVAARLYDAGGREVAPVGGEPAVGLLLAVDLRRARLRAVVRRPARTSPRRPCRAAPCSSSAPAAAPASTTDIVREAVASVRPSTDGATRYGWWKVPDSTVAATDAMFSGFIRTPPWPMSEAAIWAAALHRHRAVEGRDADGPVVHATGRRPAGPAWSGCRCPASARLADEGGVAGAREARLERAALDLEVVVVVELPAAVREVLGAGVRLVRGGEALLDQQRRR